MGELLGAGMLLALALPIANGDAIVEAAREKGLIINAARPDTLRFMPALNVSREEIATCSAILNEVLTHMATLTE